MAMEKLSDISLTSERTKQFLQMKIKQEEGVESKNRQKKIDREKKAKTQRDLSQGIDAKGREKRGKERAHAIPSCE